MKKLMSFALVITLLIGVLAVLPVSAVQAETLDDHLITHWDFVGDNPLADKATVGSSSDTLKLGGSAKAVAGTAVIPDWSNQNSNHYLYAENSDDLFRTTENRTVFIVFTSSKGDFANGNGSDHIELLGQNGAMRIGISGTNEFFASTNSHTMGENKAYSTGMNTFVANTWTTVAVSWAKNTETGSITVTSAFKVGDGEWITGTNSYTDVAQTWLQDDSDAGATDTNNLVIGRRTSQTGSTWGGDLTIDDIRIYDKALTVAEIQSIKVSDRNIEDYLISHWDFVGSNPLADKALKGSSSDTMNISGAVTVSDGVAYIPDYKNGGSEHYLYVEDSAELFRTTEDRTIFIVFKSSKGDFANDGKNDSIELIGQNGAMRIGINGDNKLFASTNSHTQGENYAKTDGMNTFVADTWTTLAISWAKDVSTGSIVVTSAFKVGDGEWVTGTISHTDTAQTWLQDDSDAGKTDTNNLVIGRRTNSAGSTWGGDLTIDDIRVYGCALNVNEIQTIAISNDNNDPATPGEGDGSVTNVGHSLTLDDKIGVNFHVSVNEAVAATASVRITNGTTELFSARLADVAAQADGTYKLTGKIAPKQMGDTINISVSDADENVIYRNSYSAKQYIEYVLENKKADTKLVALVKAMANYGAYAQIKFGYNDDVLVNSVLDEAERTLADVVKQELGGAKVNGAVDGIKYLGATLVLDDATHVVFNFSVENIAVTSDMLGGADDYVFNSAKGNLQIKSKGLCAQNLTAEQIASITVDGETVTVAYSPMTYIMNNINHADAKTANVVKALYAYYSAAADYLA